MTKSEMHDRLTKIVQAKLDETQEYFPEENEKGYLWGRENVLIELLEEFAKWKDA
jgi:hypothetical protein